MLFVKNTILSSFFFLTANLTILCQCLLAYWFCFITFYLLPLHAFYSNNYNYWNNYLCCTKCRLRSGVARDIAASTTRGPKETEPTSSQSSPTNDPSILLEKIIMFGVQSEDIYPRLTLSRSNTHMLMFYAVCMRSFSS